MYVIERLFGYHDNELHKVVEIVPDYYAGNPLSDWDHGVNIVTMRRGPGCDKQRYEHDNETVELWDRVVKRVDCQPCEFQDVEQRRSEMGAWFDDVTHGGLIDGVDDAAEIFTRMMRLRGVTVLSRELTGAVQSEWMEVLAWATDQDSEQVHAVLDTLENHIAGEEYGAWIYDVETVDGEYELIEDNQVYGLNGYTFEQIAEYYGGQHSDGPLRWTTEAPARAVYRTTRERVA